MGGIIGRLFREFAVTLSVAIVVSLCVSLTTTPMMCARFLKSEKEIKHGKMYQASERVFQWSVETYAAGLRWVLRHQPFMLVLTGATICLSVYLYIVIPKGFFPQQDTGLMTGNILGAQDTSFPVMQQKLKQYTDIVMSDPAVKSMVGRHRRRGGKYGADGDRTEASQRTKSHGGPGDRAPPAQTCGGSGSHTVSAGESRHHGRRADQQFAISIHAIE